MPLCVNNLCLCYVMFKNVQNNITDYLGICLEHCRSDKPRAACGCLGLGGGWRGGQGHIWKNELCGQVWFISSRVDALLFILFCMALTMNVF